MNREDHPSLLLADRHVIPILLFVEGNQDCTRTDVYTKVARDVNMPRKIDKMAFAGLLEQTQVGIACRLRLTGTGREVARLIREIDDLMRETVTETVRG